MNIDLTPRQVRQLTNALDAIEQADRLAGLGDSKASRIAANIANLRIIALRGHCEARDADPDWKRHMEEIDANLRRQLARVRARLPAVA